VKSVYMDKRWLRLHEEKEGGEAVFFEYSRGGKKIKYPFIKRIAGTVGGNQYYDLVTPMGLCGPWIENCDDVDVLVRDFDRDFDDYCSDEHIVAEYIRFSPWNNSAKDFGKVYEMHFHEYVFSIDLTSEFFYMEYSPKVRNTIRKAINSGVKIVFEKEEGIDDFLRLYHFTESKYNVSSYYILDRSFVKKYFELFPEEAIIAKAVYKGKVVSSSLILLGEDIAHYHFAGNDPERTALQGNSLLIYEACLLAARKNKKLFDLDRARVGSSLEAFKKNFIRNRERYSCIVGTKIRNRKVYSDLVMQAGGPRKGYFPAYRKGGW